MVRFSLPDKKASRFRRQVTMAPGKPPRRRWLAAAVVFLVGLAVTLALFFWERDRDLHERRFEFERSARQLASMVETGLLYPLEVLRSLPAFYESSTEVTRAEFRHFVRGALGRHKGIFAFEWVPIVAGKDRVEYEQLMRDKGLTDFEIREFDPKGGLVRAGSRSEYMPIVFEEPSHGMILGLDLAHSGQRSRAPLRSRKVGDLVASASFTLAEDPKGGQVVAVYHRVFDNAGVAVEGVVNVILKVETILRQVLHKSGLAGLHITLLDETANDAVLFSNGPDLPAQLASADDAFDTKLDFADRRWKLRMVAAPGSKWAEAGIPWLLLASGMIVSILLAAGAASLMTILGLHRKVAEALQLGQYRLEEKLGEGGMGEVYRASHAMLRRPTAVKLLTADKASTEARMRFEREVQLTSQLTHPNTVAIFDFGHTPNGTFYYAMEYLVGLDPEEIVKRSGPLPAGRAIHLLEQICGSLFEAHAAGLVHRDIKPANILVGERGKVCDFVKVLDFGLVKDLAETTEVALTRADSFVGTPLFMCPEAAKSPADMGPRGDLYSVGAVAYLLVTGEPPFDGGGFLEIVTRHVSEAPQPPSKRLGRAVDEDLEKIILRCLEKDPANRYQDADELRDALLSCRAAGTWSAKDAAAWWKETGA